MLATTIQRINLVAHKEDVLLVKIMVDQLIHVHLAGFAPSQLVTIQVVYTPGNGVWRAQATFLTDENGHVDIASQAPLSGSYHGIDVMGLFWSMELDKHVESPGDNRIKITAMQNEHVQAVAIFERAFVAPGVTRRRVRERGLYGTLVLPPGTGPHPGLLVLGGSEGGLPEFAAQMFASHGYAALALAYFRYESLPSALLSIPLEYFETALQWMQSQECVQADGIGVYGGSKGGELALLLGATFPSIKAVVSIAPSAFVYHGLSSAAEAGSRSSWSLHGQDLPYIPFLAKEEFDQKMQKGMQEQTPIALMPLYLHSFERADAETVKRAIIHVEDISGPVLLISGQDDQMWPSSLFSDIVMARLEQKQHPYPYKHLEYPEAGHRITFPYQPTTINSADMGAFQWALGGNASGQAAAAQDAWACILEFLKQHLSLTM